MSADRAIRHADDVERVLASYRDRIGLAAEAVPTPALLLDRPTLERNIVEMERLVAGGARLRPHAKTHKSPEIAAIQLQAGAIGIMTSTVWEALALARAGTPDLLVGNMLLSEDPFVQDLNRRWVPPAFMEGGRPQHLLGTDGLGRDYLARLLYGARFSLFIGFAVMIAHLEAPDHAAFFAPHMRHERQFLQL